MAQAGGGPVEADETLVEISTDKVDADVPTDGSDGATPAPSGTPVSAESPPTTPQASTADAATEAALSRGHYLGLQPGTSLALPEMSACTHFRPTAQS